MPFLDGEEGEADGEEDCMMVGATSASLVSLEASFSPVAAVAPAAEGLPGAADMFALLSEDVIACTLNVNSTIGKRNS
jgi:hypothetical protein